jgi:hypothetical protein
VRSGGSSGRGAGRMRGASESLTAASAWDELGEGETRSEASTLGSAAPGLATTT